MNARSVHDFENLKESIKYKRNYELIIKCTSNIYFICDYMHGLYSDDRSVEVFRQRIESATQMHSIGNEEKLPNCLLIDEIDGAPAVSI